MNKVIIHTRLTLEDFIHVNYAIFFKKTGTKLIITVLGLMAIMPWVLYFVYDSAFVDWTQSLIGIGVFTLFLVAINFGARRSYNTNKRLSEPVTYDFSDERLLITTENSNASISWDKIYRVTETKRCLVIWQSVQLVNCIPKRDMNEADRAIIKSIVQQNKVRNKLK